MEFRVQLPEPFRSRLFGRNKQESLDPAQLEAGEWLVDKATAVSVLRAYVDTLQDFLRNHTFLHNVNCIDFFCEYSWTRDSSSPAYSLFPTCEPLILPEDWARTFDDPELSVEMLCEMVQKGQAPSTWPQSLQTFVQQAHAIGLPRKPCTVLETANGGSRLRRGFQVGMNPKKIHEVERFSEFIHRYCHSSASKHSPDMKEDWVLDFGAGQGYLSSVLCYDRGFNVLAVDGDEVQTCGSKYRNQRLGKIQEQENLGILPPPNVPSVATAATAATAAGKKWLHTTKRIGNDRLRDLLEPLELDSSKGRWTLCGLHACGDLSVAMLKIFQQDAEIQAIANVTCCYHRLSTECELEEGGSAEKVCYPTSSYLRNATDTLRLPKRARVLACQSPWRWGTKQSIDEVALMFRKHLFRCVFQVFLSQRGLRSKTTEGERLYCGNLHARYFQDFDVYVRMVLSRNMSVELVQVDERTQSHSQEFCGLLPKQIYVERGELQQLFSRYETEGYRRLAALWSLRALLSGALESLMLVDRVLMLLESEEPLDIALLPLFDPEQSPRNMVLWAGRRTN